MRLFGWFRREREPAPDLVIDFALFGYRIALRSGGEVEEKIRLAYVTDESWQAVEEWWEKLPSYSHASCPTWWHAGERGVASAHGRARDIVATLAREGFWRGDAFISPAEIVGATIQSMPSDAAPVTEIHR